MRGSLFGLIALMALSQPLAAPKPAAACAPAPRMGESVGIADEEALIVYDPVAGVEHFVRRAAFRTAAADFGFLVPTPTIPTLAEAPASLFMQLGALIAPRVEVRTRHRGFAIVSCCLSPWLLLMRSGNDGATARPPVEVISTQRLAGYEATVLRAEDPAALGRWLGAHGYADSADLREWIAPYIAQRWVVTAFRVAKADAGDARPPSTSNVRMTFATPRAVYPYREPASQRSGDAAPRRLRLHVVAPGRVQGTLGSAGGAFPGVATYARPLRSNRRLFEGMIPAGAISADAWLTSFDDTSSPRPGIDDVWFAPDPSQSERTPPPEVAWVDKSIPMPIDLVFFVAVGALWWRRRSQRRG